MAERWQRASVRVATGLAALALAMATATVLLSLTNANRQTEVARRQLFINQSQTLARINGALINALADAAVHQQDKAIQSLLASAGITASLRTASAAPSPAATTADPASATKPAPPVNGKRP